MAVPLSTELTAAAPETSWAAAFEAHSRELRSFLARRLRREADDLLQETFARALAAPQALRDPESLRAYLYTIARHLVIDRLRRRRPVLFSELGEGEAVDPVTPAPGPEQEAVESDLRGELEREIADLPEAHRTAFRLAVEERLPYAEVARRTGWSLAQVKINVYRARQRLLLRLGPALARGEEAR